MSTSNYRTEIERRFNGRSAPVTTDAYNELERNAAAHARSSRGETRGIYNRDAITRMTTQRAIAQALEDSPEIYQEYRERHNAASILNALARAGVKLQAA